MRVAVFAYNFPHRKTQDFLFRLLLEKVDIALVLAADPVELGIPAATIRTKIRSGGLVHPRDIAARFGLRYEVVEHNSPRAADLLRQESVDLAFIAGARILRQPVIQSVPLGIVNFHPGLIPEVRGLDALQWAILQDQPIGVTAHVIDGRVDAGRLVARNEIRLFKDDTIFDISQRLYDTQVDMIPSVLRFFSKGETPVPFELVNKPNRKMPPELEATVLARLEERLRRLG